MTKLDFAPNDVLQRGNGEGAPEVSLDTEDVM